MDWSRIQAKDGWSYQITDEDVLWATRSCHGESPGDTEWVVWCMFQRLYLTRRSYKTLTALFQAYSQPINPRWRRDGDKCRPGARYHSTEACSPTRLRRRGWFAQASYDDIRSGKRGVAPAAPGLPDRVFALCRGETANPCPGAVHFAVKRLVLKSVNKWKSEFGEGSDSKLITGVAPEGGWFHSVPASYRWKPGFIFVPQHRTGEEEEEAEAAAAVMGQTPDFQRCLSMLGYDVEPDGEWDESSAWALQHFELLSGLEPDGIPDPASWTLLTDAVDYATSHGMSGMFQVCR